MQDLDAKLARALGERVCGGEWQGLPWEECDRCGASRLASSPRERLHLPPPPYSSSWEAAGRLIGEMKLRGYGFEIEIALEGGHVAQVVHYNRSRGTCWKGAQASGATVPEALALAALRALGGEG